MSHNGASVEVDSLGPWAQAHPTNLKKYWGAEMTRNKTVLLAPGLALAAILASAPQAIAASIVWELEGVSTPESVLHDPERGVLYVSNIAGEATGKDGAGHISRVSPAGEMLEAEWVTGLDAPKGLVLAGDTLYVSDIDRLVAIDIAAGAISGTWPAEGAVFLNDTAVDAEGRVYVSDMATNRIHRLDGDTLSVWVEGEALQHRNGLKVDGDQLVVAAWGKELQDDFSTLTPGHLYTVDLATGDIAALGSGDPVGNLDGLEREAAGNWLVTDWIAGGLLRISPDGSFEQLIDLDMGSADLAWLEAERLAVIPMMLDDRIVAYRLD